MDSAQYAELFLTESREHVSAMNHALLALEQAGDAGGVVAGDQVSAIFRAVHTVKGMSATMGYTAIADLSHQLESLLDRVRRGALQVSPQLMDLLFRSADTLEAAVEEAVQGRDAPPGTASLLDALRTFSRTSGGMTAIPAPTTGSVWSVEVPDGDGVGIRVRLVRDTPLRGVRAYLVVEAARRLGTVTAISPSIGQLQAEQFGDDFALRLVTDDVEGALAMLRSAGDVADAVLAESAPEMFDLLALEHAGPGLVPGGGSAGPRVQHHVRIDLRRLDALMNLIGELVITRGRLVQLAMAADDVALTETVAQASRLVGDLQDEIMQSRMVPVGQVFDRFPRLVRDVARTLEKQVAFTIEGTDIELDRSMLDEIGDPVMHLIRNALDHGVESPAVRVAAGKPPQGRLTLSAFRDRSAVVVRVEDDGRGIDRARVIARARERGLIHGNGADLTDDDVVKLITRAGFSTAERVTDISGRGVGLDVVVAGVRSLGGSVDVRSTPGRGTSVTMRLPLTLAIQRSLLARVGGETYALPLTHVSETVELTPETLQAVKGREVLVLREDVLPVLRLRELVGLPRSAQADPEQVVVLETADRRAALIVDDLTTQLEIVVKQFDGVRGGSTLFGGATILGDGAPALILDVSSLL
ncbi:MAG: chemotaxis protein CheA [Gemmatimonadaceae bacterium]|nr:chemotaxis protein CheA [Gemmatimonadaceae bacterium]